jgi:hypothetical protein
MYPQIQLHLSSPITPPLLHTPAKLPRLQPIRPPLASPIFVYPRRVGSHLPGATECRFQMNRVVFLPFLFEGRGLPAAP